MDLHLRPLHPKSPKKRAPGTQVRGPYPSECYAGIWFFSTSACNYRRGGRNNLGPRRDLGGTRSEPPLPEDTRGDYSMRLSGSPPFACRQLREVYYHARCTAREISQALSRSSRRSLSRSRALLALRSLMRSEERRVGKECRSRW